MTLGWSLTYLDTYIFDSVSALVYCMDYSGPEYFVWREVSTLFTNNASVNTLGRYMFKLPNCGPNVGAAAVRVVARGFGGSFQQEDACVFGVEPLAIMTPDPPYTTTSLTNKVDPTPTSGGSNILPTNTNPVVPTNTGVPPVISPKPTEAVTTSDTPQVTTTPEASSKIDPNTGSSTSGSSGSGGGGSVAPAVQTHQPLPSFPNPGGALPPVGPTVEKNDTSSALKATLLSVGVFAGLAAVVVPLLVMRRRRMRRSRQLATAGEVAGAAGGAMKEKKRHLGRRKPQEGYFYKMDDDDDEGDDNDGHSDMQSSGDLEKRHAAAATASNADGTTETRDRSPAVGAGVRELDAVTVPQMAFIGDTTTTASYHKRRSSLPYMVTSSYTMSSLGGSSVDDDSSVVRKYWAASMAARAERRLEGHSPTRGLDGYDGSDSYGYDEGSIFGDQSTSASRDSDSRMADILSLRTTGSVDGTTGSTMDTSRHRHLYDQQYGEHHQYRRDTLNTSFGGVSTRTMTPSLSSADDSCPFGEEEFLERMHLQQLQAQLQHEYYAQQQREQRYHDYGSSMGSRRTSSVPSLTSTNDPFKTFDSNEIVLDHYDHLNPFADPIVDSRCCTPSPVPSLRVPGSRLDTFSSAERTNSDLVRAFPPAPASP
ncbi:hypothetical protein EC991_000770 [Linnemannia zychae]|nr:hypothetical protein EC991_000770 [Linnemannia zychae]